MLLRRHPKLDVDIDGRKSVQPTQMASIFIARRWPMLCKTMLDGPTTKRLERSMEKPALNRFDAGRGPAMRIAC